MGTARGEVGLHSRVIEGLNSLPRARASRRLPVLRNKIKLFGTARESGVPQLVAGSRTKDDCLLLSRRCIVITKLTAVAITIFTNRCPYPSLRSGSRVPQHIAGLLPKSSSRPQQRCRRAPIFRRSVLWPKRKRQPGSPTRIDLCYNRRRKRLPYERRAAAPCRLIGLR